MGKALARRITHRTKNVQFPKHDQFVDLNLFPTTVFTPLEFSTCGLSEEAAIEKLGRDNVAVYHVKYMALEEEILDKYDDVGDSQKDMVYAKAVVNKKDDKVVGLHFTAPNAAEIMQGFAVAMKMGLTKQMMDKAIGIHPTVAETLTDIEVTKESG